jgi:hypothetical protein
MDKDKGVTASWEAIVHREMIYEHPKYKGIPLTPDPRFQGYWNEFCHEANPTTLNPVTLEWQVPVSSFMFKAMGDILPYVLFNLTRSGKLMLRGTVIDFVRMYGWTWCHSRQRGFFSMAIDSKWKIALVSPLAYSPGVVHPPKAEPIVKKLERFRFRIMGPNVEDIATYVGSGELLGTISTSDVDYEIASQDRGDRIQVPLEVKAIYQQRYMEKDFTTPDLVKSDYYKRSMASYSSWSLAIHMDQIKDVLKNVPSSWTVIAPADGLGVVARSWTGKVVSGDQVKTELSESCTRQEQIEQTLDRGYSAKGDKVIVFSYCWDWVTQDVKHDLAVRKTPFLVLQPTDHMKIDESGLFFRHFGPGLFGSFVPVEWEFHVHQVERFRPSSGVLYSENLLVHRGFQFYSYSDYFKYFSAMKPMAPVWCHWDCGDSPLNHKEDKTLPHLASNLSELFDILAKKSDAEVYFAPIGRMFSRVVLWDFRRGKESSRYLAPAREVIAVPQDWVLLPMVKKYFPFFEHEKIIYFYCSVPQILPLHVAFVIRYAHTVIGKIEFVDRGMISEYHPYVRQSNTNLIIASKHMSMNVCICSLQTDSDIAKLILNFFPDGECPLYFVQEIVLFASSNGNTVGMEKWKDLRPQAILKLGLDSKLEFKTLSQVSHCSRFNPWCAKCRDEVLGITVTLKPCRCYHQDLVMANTQIYATGNRGEMSNRCLSPPSVEQLRECSGVSTEEDYVLHDYLSHLKKDPLDVDPLTELPSIWDCIGHDISDEIVLSDSGGFGDVDNKYL